MLAPSDPATQLVKLREPVPVGVLHEHHGRVGDIDADLDHGGGDKHRRRTGRKRRDSQSLTVSAAERPSCLGARAGCAACREPAVSRHRQVSERGHFFTVA